jgi:hypothetical protein
MNTSRQSNRNMSLAKIFDYLALFMFLPAPRDIFAFFGSFITKAGDHNYHERFHDRLKHIQAKRASVKLTTN